MASVTIDELHRLYTVEKKSTHDIANIIGCNYSATRRLLIKAKVQLRTATEGIRAARHKLGHHMRGKTVVFSEETKQRIRQARLAHGEKYAKGTRITSNGYVEFTRGKNKGKMEHVVVMEEMIGRHLHKEEVVHHVDECRSNNKRCNLMLLTRSAHTQLHRRLQSENKHG